MSKAIDKEIREIMALRQAYEELRCDKDVVCMLTKAKLLIELTKRVDKLVHQLAFIYTGGDDELREVIETIVDTLIEAKLVTREKWERTVLIEARFRQYLDRKLLGVKEERV